MTDPNPTEAPPLDHDDPYPNPTGPDPARSRKSRLDPRSPESSDPDDAFDRLGPPEPPGFFDLPERPRSPAYPTGLDVRGASALARARLSGGASPIGLGPDLLAGRVGPASSPISGPDPDPEPARAGAGGTAWDRAAPGERTPRLAGALDPGDPIRSGPDHPLVDLNRRMLEGITELVRLQGQVGRQGLPR